MNRMTEAIGFAAAALTSMAFLPQVVKAWRTRSVADLSLETIAAQTAGVALWVGYGVLIGAAPVIVSNTITLALMVMLLVFKLRYA